MTGLYPIIRRVRRPLILEEAETQKTETLTAASAEVKSVNEVAGATVAAPLAKTTTHETRVLPENKRHAATVTKPVE